MIFIDKLRLVLTMWTGFRSKWSIMYKVLQLFIDIQAQTLIFKQRKNIIKNP